MKKLVIISLAFLFIFTEKAHAANLDIVINEVSPNPEGPSTEDSEFIELFNKGTETISITGWKLADTQGSTRVYIIPDNSIEPGKYKSFSKGTTEISLNNDSDGVTLRDTTDQQIDSMFFSSSIDGKSWSRSPNGTGTFVNETTPTENSINSTPPTPIPTNTPTPGPTSTPTNTPTLTPTKTPTPAPTVTAATLSPTKSKTSPSPIPTTSEEQVRTMAMSDSQNNQPPQKEVMGSNVEMGGNLDALEAPKQSYNWWKLLIVMGTVIITGACGVFLYNNHIKERSEELTQN